VSSVPRIKSTVNLHRSKFNLKKIPAQKPTENFRPRHSTLQFSSISTDNNAPSIFDRPNFDLAHEPSILKPNRVRFHLQFRPSCKPCIFISVRSPAQQLGSPTCGLWHVAPRWLAASTSPPPHSCNNHRSLTGSHCAILVRTRGPPGVLNTR
jgi:hypothetical protein